MRQAIAAGLEEIDVIVREAANDNDAKRSMVESIAREPLNPIDQWRGIERLVALGWTEEAIAVALALPVRQIRKLRLLANVLPAMLDHMALGDMPNEQQLRTIATASLDEQKEAWKALKPKKNERADWYNISRARAQDRGDRRQRRPAGDVEAANVVAARWLISAIPNPFESGNLIEQAHATNPALEIIARAHSDAEVDYLKKCGTSLIIMGAREIARGISEHILSKISTATAAKGEAHEASAVTVLDQHTDPER